jgi:hypothetical protein
MLCGYKPWEERERAVKSRCYAAGEAQFFVAGKDANHSVSGKGITQVLKACQKALEGHECDCQNLEI